MLDYTSSSRIRERQFHNFDIDHMDECATFYKDWNFRFSYITKKHHQDVV